MKLDYPATGRNRGPILEVISKVLPSAGTVLEIASGSGQHAVYFAEHLPGLRWQPTSPDPAERASIEAWRDEAQLPNLQAPLALDVLEQPWPVDRADAVFNANMIHIAPWEVAAALFDGAAALLSAGAVMITYGPYRFDGDFGAASNAEFDRSLRARDASWGIRDVVDLDALGERTGWTRERTIGMPANNHTLVWRRR